MANRPQPKFPEPNTLPFWEGCKQRELRYPMCRPCNSVIFTPRIFCPKCGRRDLDWRVSAGEGCVYTFSVIRQNRMPGFIELGAYSIAYVDLDEGFRMMSSVVGVDNPTTDIHIGQRVKVHFEAQGDTQDADLFPIPLFRPI